MAHVLPQDSLIRLLGTRAFGPRNLTGLSLFVWFSASKRNYLMPHQLEAFKIAERARLSLSRVFLVVTASGCCGPYLLLCHVSIDALSLWCGSSCGEYKRRGLEHVQSALILAPGSPLTGLGRQRFSAWWDANHIFVDISAPLLHLVAAPSGGLRFCHQRFNSRLLVRDTRCLHHQVGYFSPRRCTKLSKVSAVLLRADSGRLLDGVWLGVTERPPRPTDVSGMGVRSLKKRRSIYRSL